MQASSESPETKTYWGQWDHLQIQNGALYRGWESAVGSTTKWQLIIPRSLTNKVLRHLHDAKSAGHLGVAMTLESLKQRFYWHKCTQDVRLVQKV